MPYTKQLLLNNSSMAQTLAREGRSVKGVLSMQEQNALARENKSFQVISNGKVFWFTDDYCMGVNKLLPSAFVPSSTVCPNTVVPRASLPSGVIRTAEDFIKIYCQNERHIKTIDELVEFLNSTQ